MKRLFNYLRFGLLVAVLVIINYVVVARFNTLVWRNLWPYPAIFLLIAGLSVLVWFPEFGRSIWMFRIVGVLMIFIGESYFIHSIQITLEYPSWLTILHLIGFTGMFLGLVLNFLNQSRPKNTQEPKLLPADLPFVAIVVPTYGEPYDVLEKTILSIKKLDYPSELMAIIISDDAHRPELRQMAELQRINYNPGAKKDAKAGNLNSALAFIDEYYPEATLILTQDADEVVHSTFLRKTIGYLKDPKVAFVQTPKEVIAPKNDPFGTRDRLFYDVLQVGRNGFNAAFACGSGVLWRIEAIKSIGGFVTWNVVEDLTTSYYLHAAGWKSAYHNEILSIGLAPEDIPGLLKQRGTWAVDTWRLFLFDNPLFKKGLLSNAQRLQYLELGMFYTMSTFFMPMLLLTPLLSLLTGLFLPIEGWALFPWLAISFLYYAVLSHGHGLDMLRMWQYWIGLSPTYAKAFWIALRSRNTKPAYVVTRKTRDKGFYAYLLWPQFLYLALAAFAIVQALLSGTQDTLGARLTNIGILLFFAFMVSRICRTAFYGVNEIVLRLPEKEPAMQGKNRLRPVSKDR